MVVVTINYRCGVFGFFETEGGDSNCGYWDQIEALRWVQKEIHAFGTHFHLQMFCRAFLPLFAVHFSHHFLRILQCFLSILSCLLCIFDDQMLQMAQVATTVMSRLVGNLREGSRVRRWCKFARNLICHCL